MAAACATLGMRVAAQEALVLPGCGQREYVYLGARLLAIVDAAPTVTAGFTTSSASVPESGTANLQVSATLPPGSTSLSCPVNVDYATSNGVAVAGNDYTAASGTLTFSGTTTTRLVPVSILPDALYEGPESFTVTLSNPRGATLATSVLAVSIQNDDPLPQLSVSNVTLAESNAGTTAAQFVLSLSAVSGLDATALYSTADGSATAGSDYTAVSGALATVPAGQISRNFSVNVGGDATWEPDETFFLNLGSPANATLADGQGQGTILNDDAPAMSITDVRSAEGQAGTTVFQFIVSLQGPTTQTVTTQYLTANCTAFDTNNDYVPVAAQPLQFTPGVTSRTASVTVNGDTQAEAFEIFLVGLSAPVNATLLDGTAQGSIENDDVNIAASYPKADFNGDGNVDLLFRHAVSGKLVTWEMAGVNRIAGLFLTPDGLADLSWRLVGTADFGSWTGSAVGPADGKTDILWGNDTSGRLVVWLMDGTIRQAGVFLSPDVSSGLSWGVVGTGNFSQAPAPAPSQDLLWHDGSTGALEVWAMNGPNRVGGVIAVSASQPDLNWQVVGTGDFNGDAQSDIWWRNASNGQLQVWQMNGATRSAVLTPVPGQLADLNWKVWATPDLDRDGKPDMLWRNDLSGNMVVWLMNNQLSRTCGVYLNPPSLTDANWVVRGPR